MPLVVMFFAGLLVGAAALSLLLLPRLQAARQQAAGEAEHSERRLAELRAATEEKIALVAGNREQLAEQMKAISADALRHIFEQVEKLATAQREADRATAAGE